MHRLKRFFFTGLFTILPIGVTIFVLVWLFQVLDQILGEFLEVLFEKLIPNFNYIPGIGFLVLIIIIFLIGIFVSNVIGKRIAAFFEKIFTKIPIVRTLYRAIRDVLQKFQNSDEKSFKQVVLVEFPKKGVYSMGFLTNEKVSFIKEDSKVAVFVPTTPNPTNGYLIFVDKEEVEYIDMPVDEGIKTVVSMGSIQKKD